MNMREEHLAELRKGYRHAVAIGGVGMMGALFVYALVFELVVKRGTLPPATLAIRPEMAVAVMAGLALLVAFTHKLLSRAALLAGESAPAGRASGIFPPVIQKLVANTILVSGLFHTVGLVGFIFSFLTLRPDYVYFGIALSLLLNAFYFPRFRQWEEWDRGETRG